MRSTDDAKLGAGSRKLRCRAIVLPCANPKRALVLPAHLKPIVGARLPLSDAVKAHQLLESASVMGKLCWSRIGGNAVRLGRCQQEKQSKQSQKI